MPDSTSPLFGAINLPFQEQLAFWERKEIKGSRHWLDIRHAQHDRWFVVAGAEKADLLHDLQQAVSGLQGGTLEHFRKNFREIVKKHGWTGWTGEGSAAGEAWRTKVIWQTNIRASYAAGRYAQLTSPEAKAALPYWKYTHSGLSMNPRADHLAWDGMTLPNDHPFWNKGFPPNGFGCGCYVVGVRKPEEGAMTNPPEGWEQHIGKGWDYAPGKSVADEVRQIVEAKAAKYPEPLRSDFLAQAEKVGIVPDEEKLSAARVAKTEGDAKKWLIQQGKATGFENAVIYDAATGKEIGRYEGQHPARFYLPEDISKRTYQRGEQLALLHNHPDSVSLSGKDLLILARPGVAKILAYGHTGAWFAAEKGAEMSKLALVLDAAKTELKRQTSLLSLHRINTGGIQAHILNLALARAGIISYTSKLDKTRALLYDRGKDAIEAAVQEIVYAIERTRL
ncbi:MAG: phage minor head protein [Betaproteobacteria bacterium]|nr:phage minor head protein [Betaproteobacteria bacterium]